VVLSRLRLSHCEQLNNLAISRPQTATAERRFPDFQ
jgi:hypothetical protein